MTKKKVFGYVDRDVFDFLTNTKEALQTDYNCRNVSKSKIISLAVHELETNNDITTIKDKLSDMGFIDNKDGDANGERQELSS